MCGIAGFIDLKAQTSAERLEDVAGAMAQSLSHRGPDGGGVWTDPEAGVALAHRRLAVRDLSPAGNQPMATEDGRNVLVYNGEAYDIDELRADLERRGWRFRGTSDTEIVLNACAEFGVIEALGRLNGMFAFALWDRDRRTLWLVRDRMGIKPLYWTLDNGLFVFASEPRAFYAHPDWRAEIDRDALAAYARLSYVPAPSSIWRGVCKLEPGTALTFKPGAAPHIRRYWDLAEVAGRDRLVIAPGEAADRLERLLRRAVKRRLVSDVPLGVFLSGGTDSGLVAALMGAESQGLVKTFTVGFEDAGYDEADDAAKVARHLGTDHAAITVSADDAMACIPDLADCYDEPFADSSQIPMVLISRFTRGQVSVALSGDGGDELFAGYNRYLWAARHWPRQRMVPSFLRNLAASAIEAIPPGSWDRIAAGLSLRQPGEKMHKLAAVLRMDDAEGAYHALRGHGVDTQGLVAGGTEPAAPSPPPGLRDPVARMQFLDSVTYLPDDILTKVDRASMSVGLEARVPLLDHEVVEFVWRLPEKYKLRGGRGKILLREVLYRHLPRSLFEGRPKSGFAVPLDRWLRGPLREWAGDLLAAQTLRNEGYFDAAMVGEWWKAHLSGRRNRHHALWNVLMFQAWLGQWGTARAGFSAGRNEVFKRSS